MSTARCSASTGNWGVILWRCISRNVGATMSLKICRLTYSERYRMRIVFPVRTCTIQEHFIFSILGIKKVSPKLRDKCCHKLWHNYSPFLGGITVTSWIFAYVGKEYRLQIGETENFIDLLFYNLRHTSVTVSTRSPTRGKVRRNANKTLRERDYKCFN